MLKLNKALLFKFLNYKKRLKYKFQNKNKINKNIYKNYLKIIIVNLNKMLLSKIKI